MGNNDLERAGSVKPRENKGISGKILKWIIAQKNESVQQGMEHVWHKNAHISLQPWL